MVLNFSDGLCAHKKVCTDVRDNRRLRLLPVCEQQITLRDRKFFCVIEINISNEKLFINDSFLRWNASSPIESSSNHINRALMLYCMKLLTTKSCSQRITDRCVLGSLCYCSALFLCQKQQNHHITSIISCSFPQQRQPR